MKICLQIHRNQFRDFPCAKFVPDGCDVQNFHTPALKKKKTRVV